MRPEPIPVDEGLILAAQRATTGANAHCIGETIDQYRRWCRRGEWRNVRTYKQALLYLINGQASNAKIARDMAYDYFFNLRKEEVRAQGHWSKDWEEYLGPSPEKQ